MKYSEKTDELFAALAAFQGEVTNPPRGAENPFFKSRYTQLDAMIDHVKPVLARHGLSYLQMPCSSDGAVGVTTTLCHESGQYVEGDAFYLKTAKPDAQAGGSAITYARRYALAAALGIAPDTDDDGNAASEQPKKSSDRGPAPIKFPCQVCGTPVEREIAEKSRAANGGNIYCSGTCRDKDAEK